jgi:hypothetical protein
MATVSLSEVLALLPSLKPDDLRVLHATCEALLGLAKKKKPRPKPAAAAAAAAVAPLPAPKRKKKALPSDADSVLA